MACACYLPADVDIDGIADSKTITTEKAREAIYEQLREAPGVRYALARADAPLIDEATLEKCDVSVRRKLRQAADDGTEDGTLSAAEVAEARRLGRLQTPPCRP